MSIAQKVKKLRHAEYYDCQHLFDSLYRKSQRGEGFRNLLPLITSEENILLAYRNIKKNNGSQTPGIDKKTMKFFTEMSEERFVSYIRAQFADYHPKPVKRVEIPKPNGKMRPLGIPCITDRIVQQCILQVLEPICEAKFYDHSYGFRPLRSTEHAIACCYRLAQLCNLHYVVEMDIEGFFDHVNHKKLMRQLWTMGVKDTKLLCIIKRILKATIILPDGSAISPSMGTPQGGILSPLLANVVLNELDWWIASQWELYPWPTTSPQFEKNGVENRGNKYRAMRKTGLKRMHIVRYADDFLIFCSTRTEANRVYEAVKQWLQTRLHLKMCDEKSKVTNLKRHYCEFLGFKFKVVPRRNKYVICSHISEKSMTKIQGTLSGTAKQILRPHSKQDLYNRISLYNAKVIGIQNYFAKATCVSADLHTMQRAINKMLGYALKKELEPGERILTGMGQYLNKRYGTSKQLRYLMGIPVAPIGYVHHTNACSLSTKVRPYTEEGRKAVHKNLQMDVRVLHHLMRNPSRNQSVEFNDNRLALYAAQHGMCGVLYEPLSVGDCHCHHKTPKKAGGDDKYSNLILIKEAVHRLIHATTPELIAVLIAKLHLNVQQMKKVNNLRVAAGLAVIQ